MSEVHELIDEPGYNPLCAAIELWRNTLCQRRDLRNTHRSLFGWALVVALPASDRQGFDEQQPAVMRVPRGLARLKHFSAGFR